MWFLDILYGVVLLIVDWCIPVDHPMKTTYYLAFVILMCTSQILMLLGGKRK